MTKDINKPIINIMQAVQKETHDGAEAIGILANAMIGTLLLVVDSAKEAHEMHDNVVIFCRQRLADLIPSIFPEESEKSK